MINDNTKINVVIVANILKSSRGFVFISLLTFSMIVRFLLLLYKRKTVPIGLKANNKSFEHF
jgi:hypothetical protein